MTGLTAQEAAERLGVKIDTVYTYVARGVLTSRREPGTRTSVLDAEEVEKVALRGRPRRSTQPGALDLVIRTGLTSISEGRLFYRRREVSRLARAASFEETAEWLWSGRDAAYSRPWESAPVVLPDVGDVRHRLRAAVVMASANDPLRADLSPLPVAATGRSLVATMVASIPLRGDGRAARLVLHGSRAPLRGTIAGRMWGRLSAGRADPQMVAALNAALVLLADHELAASTLAARIAASVRADPYAVVLAGLGPLAGNLHGGASRLAYELLETATSDGPAPALGRALEVHGTCPGFGHPLYPDGDPRARALLAMLRRAATGSGALAVADATIAAAHRRAGVHPNIDFALAALAMTARMPRDAGETIFTVARTAGWLAHAIEEYSETPLRFRARAVPRS